MTFVESVRTSFAKYAEFNGRASRSEYWWWGLFCTVVPLIPFLFSELAGLLVSLALLVPYLSATTRRLHDTDRSGWMQLLWLLAPIGWIVLIVWCAQAPKEPNRYGPPPDR